MSIERKKKQKEKQIKKEGKIEISGRNIRWHEVPLTMTEDSEDVQGHEEREASFHAAFL